MSLADIKIYVEKLKKWITIKPVKNIHIGLDLSHQEYEQLCEVKRLCVEDILGNMCDEAHDRDTEDQKGLIEGRAEAITEIMYAPTIKETLKVFYNYMFSCDWNEFLEMVRATLIKEFGEEYTEEIMRRVA